MRSRLFLISCLGAGMLLSPLPGCAGWRQLRKAVNENRADDVAPQRKKRQEDVARDFDQRRDEAQFQAALSRWQQNDIDGCRQMVEALLQRNPDHRPARLLLADLYVFSGRPSRAIEVLSKLVESDSKDAMAHHALAQALDVVGRRSDAMMHYELATRLEPASQLYALSYKSAFGGGIAPDSPLAQVEPLVQTASPPKPLPAGPVVPAGGPQVPAARSSPAVVQAAATIEPQNPQNPLDRAVEALAAGDTDEAINAATAGLVASPAQAAALYRILGAAHYRRGEYEAAQSALAQALSLDKGDALSYFLMGSTLSKLGHDEAAAGVFAEAGRLDPRLAR